MGRTPMRNILDLGSRARAKLTAPAKPLSLNYLHKLDLKGELLSGKGVIGIKGYSVFSKTYHGHVTDLPFI